MDGGHKLVIRAEGNLGDDWTVVLELFYVDTREERSSKNRKLGGVTDLPRASAILSQHTLRA